MGRRNVVFCAGEERTRRTPRTCVRKVKGVRRETDSHNETEPRQTRKRKPVNYDDDPNYSEGGEADPTIDGQKKVPGYRCSPHLVPEVMEKLSLKQREWVDKIGFESLQNMIGSRSPKSVTMWLVDQVDTDNGTLEVCGERISIRDGVKRLLDLHSGGKKVPQPLNGRSKAKIPKDGNSRPDDKHSDHGRGQTAKDAIKVLLAEQEDEVAFCQSFVMLVLCIYLAPTTSLNINRSYYPALMDVSEISLMDWCGFIGEYLIKGIEEFRRSKAYHVQVPGCVHLLPLLYIDALIKHNALVLPEALSLPEGEPRIHFIGSEHLAFLASSDIKTSSNNRIEYGLLQENFKGSKSSAQGKRNSLKARTGSATRPDEFSFEHAGSSANQRFDPAVLLDSLLSEIEDGREKLVQEFRLKIVDLEKKTFTRFKKLFIEGYSFAEKVHSGVEKTDTAVPPITVHDLEDGRVSSSLAGLHTKKSSEDGKSNPNEQENDTTRNVVKAKANASTEVAPAWKSNNRNSDVKKQKIGESSTWLVGKRSLVISQSGATGEDSHHLEHRDDGKDVPDSRDDNRCFDELSDVVKIGKQAVEDAGLNDRYVSDQSRGGTRLSILTEAANMEVDPIFRSPPAGDADHPHKEDTGVIAMDGTTDKHIDLGSVLKTPIFDRTPATPYNIYDMQSKRIASIPSIPTIDRDTRHIEEASFPSCMIRALVESNPTGAFLGTVEAALSEVPHLPQSDDIHETTDTPREEGSEESSSYVSGPSESPGKYDSTDPPAANDDDVSLEDDPMQTTPGFILTQSYTYDTQECIEIPDDPPSPPTYDIRHIPPLQKELECGFRFKIGSSISSSTAKVYERFQLFGSSQCTSEDQSRFRFVRCKDAAETYKIHESHSSAKQSKRFRNLVNANRDRTKIKIKRFHITKGEFFDAMKPNGEVCKTLMGLCSVTIMLDWENNKRIILDQAIIRELMREGHVCNHMSVVGKLKKLSLEDIEEIFLSMLTDNHWILAVVNVVSSSVEFYDSLLIVTEGTHPHKKLWDTISGNLEHAFSTAKHKIVTISFFECNYIKTNIQTNTHDCGFHVIQNLECYKPVAPVGDGPKSLLAYRKYLSHVLIYHRFNDLNPWREGLREEAP